MANRKLAPQAVSFWLETCGDDLSPRPRLKSDITADVAIMGGGFTGLWTAWFLLQHEPSLDIVIVERDFVGHGASGRNGGWVSPRYPVDAHAMIARFGADKARATLLALEDMVESIGTTLAEAGIDAHYRKTGLLTLARGEHQLPGLYATLRTFQRLGLADDKRILSASEAFDRVHATKVHGGLASDGGAAVHPGRLVRGLARALEARGVRIYEGTAVKSVRFGSDAGLETKGGFVSARRAVVTAGEAYLSGLSQFRRDLLPMSSMIILSEPLTPAQWEEIGWAAGESLSSPVHTKNYLTKTTDGRILYGSRGALYQYASAMPEDVVRDEAIFTKMRGEVRDWWPLLHGVRFTHSWGGYLGIPRDWVPSVWFDPDSRHARCEGYTGRGVATSALSASLLAAQVLGKPSSLEGLPFHRPQAPRWEVEPFRYYGVRYVQNAFARIDEAETAGERLPFDAPLASWLGEQ
ncbi:FAD dependent oxidoreductase [Novosphingobium nitrogenifigens DSM 19370]|uniref:FAD dependent oxidoreductase n=1 Tax=Novosphingobium nitrogenifigens DSM 19370 TaxID=983920 RepID=F1ZCB0_9SPHN|nr:FAD-dependent oxidoreductase [Novosphingobium nitrogenifigens]EGD57682.1 FAD dependent oxidoreductase [Novosphingobium nitrogenifigens DSM 19370]